MAVFEDYFHCGFSNPCHPFLQDLVEYNKISLCNLHSNSILYISIFIDFYESWLGIQPHFNSILPPLLLEEEKGGGRLESRRRHVSQPLGWDASPVPKAAAEQFAIRLDA
jgi:hypothetical protein